MSTKIGEVDNDSQDNILTGNKVVFEFLTDYHMAIIKQDVEKPVDSHFLTLLQVIRATLKPDEMALTRVVISADFIKSVSDRQPDETQSYTIERGSGLVVGKTMRISGSNVVDIIFPLYLLVPQENPTTEVEISAHIDHVGKHEAVHAHLHHLGTKPFDTNQREKFGVAMRQFVAMASEQAEEYLAELIATDGNLRTTWADVTIINTALTSLKSTLETELSAIPKDAEDYYGKGMSITFSAFHILWKALAFLAAELRNGDTFRPIPEEIVESELWVDYIAPWWEEYSQFLCKIPMSMDVDVAETDEVVKDIAKLLQRWSLDLGYDFHDTPEGEGWFQISR